jgi:hypothetical protein
MKINQGHVEFKKIKGGELCIKLVSFRSLFAFL